MSSSITGTPADVTPESFTWDAQQFGDRLAANIASCTWEPHPRFSVFTQFDQEYYLRDRDAFAHKYRCFHAVARTIAPRRIIELGTHAGASADAYLGGAPEAEYIGIDVFGENVRHDDGSPWKPYEVAEQLFAERGFTRYELIRADLRTLDRLPRQADLVVVDAAHDYANEYADLQLALTADPDFIFVDDSDDDRQAKPAIETFLREDLAGRVAYTQHVDYIGGGLVIRLKR